MKPTLDFITAGELDTEGNPVHGASRTASRRLHGIHDLEGDGSLRAVPGYSVRLVTTGMLADYSTGTVTATNGTKTITGSGTAFLANSFPGDIFTCEGTPYVIDEVTSDTVFSIKDEYEGTGGAGLSYTVTHRVWMLAPYVSTVGAVPALSDSLNLVSTTDGTFTNTEATPYGVALTPEMDIVPSSIGSSWANYISDTFTQIAIKFTLSAQKTVSGVWVKIQNSTRPSVSQYNVQIQTHNASLNKPTGTLVHANAYSSVGTYNNQIYASTHGDFFYPFQADITLSASTTYWVVIEAKNIPTTWNSTDQLSFACASAFKIDGTFVQCRRYDSSTSTWTSLESGKPYIAFFQHSDSAGNTYESADMDLGATPAADGTITISRAYPDVFESPFESENGTIINSKTLVSDTCTWELKGSASAGTAWASMTSVLAAGQTAMSKTVSTGGGSYFRYYRIKITMASHSTNDSTTPVVSAVSMSFPAAATSTSENTQFKMVGIGQKVYDNISTTATDRYNSAQAFIPTGRAAWTQYLRKFYFTTGTGPIMYWNGSDTDADAVANSTKEDGATAATDPPARASCLFLHNDRIFLTRNVVTKMYDGNATACTDTVLTDSGASFTTTGTKMIGWRLYPDTSTHPMYYRTITANDSTSATCSAGGLDDVNAGTDPYLIGRPYTKKWFYSEAEEPAHYPSAYVIGFGEDDGDNIVWSISFRGDAFCFCKNSIWTVEGYGPDTPWRKDKLFENVGLLAPRSLVKATDRMLWRSAEGIRSYGGGFAEPRVVSDRLRSILDDINPAHLNDMFGVVYDNKVLWSWATADSTINNITLIMDLDTGRFCTQAVGMYNPTVFTDDDGNNELLFWEPTSKAICKWGDGYSFAGGTQPIEWRTPYLTTSSPTEEAQFYALRVVVKSAAAVSLTAAVALTFSDSYTSVGEFDPIDTDVSARTGVSSSDMVYVLRLPETTRGTSLSVKLSAEVTDEFEIMHLEAITDPEEARTMR